MFKRIKVVNSIIIILCLLGVMQVISGALSIRGVVADKDNFLASKNTANRPGPFCLQGAQIHSLRRRIQGP